MKELSGFTKNQNCLSTGQVIILHRMNFDSNIPFLQSVNELCFISPARVFQKLPFYCFNALAKFQLSFWRGGETTKQSTKRKYIDLSNSPPPPPPFPPPFLLPHIFVCRCLFPLLLLNLHNSKTHLLGYIFH